MRMIDDLKNVIKQAEQRVHIGEVYAHFRNPEHLYKVLAIAIQEETEEPSVVYQALYGDKLIWVRAVSVWCESIDHKGLRLPRFILKSAKPDAGNRLSL